VIAKTRAELPAEYGCRLCGETKPLKQMVLVYRRRTRDYLLRPRCKLCHNQRERGHRRKWKREYLRKWRVENPEINRSYWHGPDWEQTRSARNAASYQHFLRNHHAILIKGRLQRQAGIKITLAEARELLTKYGCCYPTRYGLTAWALRECERIRSGQRRLPKHKRNSGVEIRMMMYEDGHFKKPSRQTPPYQIASRRLSQWRRQQGRERRLDLAA
jgi:hypothetical protein